MARHLLPLAALVALMACSGPALVNSSGSSSGTDGDAGTDTGTDGSTTTITVPEALAVNLEGFVYDPDNGTLEVTIAGLDSTGANTNSLVTYTRNPTLDYGVYKAYSVQEDALDRIFVALAATSDDGSVTAVTTGDGGQFNKYFAGGLYSRKGDFTPPGIGDGSGKGQVSYAGDYVAVTNIPVSRSAPTSIALAVDSGTAAEITPWQPMRVGGKIFLNANFQDNAVNGAVYDRTMLDTTSGAGFALDTIYLTPTTIESDGTFLGSTENTAQDVTGSYGGIFGGTDANSVAGVVHLEDVHDSTGTVIENAEEHGVFVLTQCGVNNTSAECSQTLPTP